MLGGQKRRKRWNPKVMVQNVEVPQAMVEQMQAQLPPVIRREPRERLKVLVQRMVEDAMRSKRQFGYVRWPASVEKELRAVGWREGEPDLVGKIEEAAARLMEVAANRQRMSDQRKATLDWHGHYNA